MALKNTVKLILANAGNIWKLLLYRIICLLCVLGLTTVIAWPIINALIKENFFVNLQNSFEGMLFNLNIEKLFVSVDNVFKNFADIISKYNYTIQTVFCGIFVVILVSFLEEYSSLAIHESVSGYMSSLTKYAFTNSYVSNFGKATIMGFSKVITTLPLNICLWLGGYLMASNLYQKIGVFAIVLTFFLLIVLLSLKNTIFCGWKPAYIIHDEGVFVSLKRGILAVVKRFFRTFSSFIILNLAMFILNVFAISLTAGVGLLITLPLTTISGIILSLVVYYESLGMRYYVDNEHIISPKKLEQQDSFARVKDII